VRTSPFTLKSVCFVLCIGDLVRHLAVGFRLTEHLCDQDFDKEYLCELGLAPERDAQLALASR